MRSRFAQFVTMVLLTVTAGMAYAGPFDNAVGTWWGQAEYLVKVNAVPDEAAQAIADLTVTVEAVERSPERARQTGVGWRVC